MGTPGGMGITGKNVSTPKMPDVVQKDFCTRFYRPYMGFWAGLVLEGIITLLRVNAVISCGSTGISGAVAHSVRIEWAIRARAKPDFVFLSATAINTLSPDSFHWCQSHVEHAPFV